jgi:acylphosphatase
MHHYNAAERGYAQRRVYAIMKGMSQSDQSTKKEELYAVVVGLVQGVGFRYFVVREAQHLGLHGFARNESDGNVEVVAQGARNSLERLLIRLQQGPPAAQVKQVQATWRQPTEHVNGFHIRW